MDLLIFPPFADPTQSYPALPILKGYVQSKGFDVRISDFNLLGLIDAADKTGSKDLFLFRDVERFYDEKSYLAAKQSLVRLYRFLSQKSGFIIDNNRHFDPEGPWSLRKIHRYVSQMRSPFHSFYEKQLASLVTKNTRLVGINLTFTSQLPEAFYLAAMSKAMFPETVVVLGGALIGQIVSQTTDAVLKTLLRMVDGICCFDGGPTLEALLKTLHESGCIRRTIPNFLFLEKDKIVRGEPLKVDFKTVPIPCFDGFDLDRYLAPSRILLFQPTSGCYWNRCSFCRYGFNQECGGQYREMEVSSAAQQLATLKNRYLVSHFYMSVDVLRPAFASALARELIAHNVNIKWSTDLRVEKSYTEEKAALLQRSGLVSVAFGVESASNSVLQKMNKGIDRETISRVSGLFYNSKVATCWMMFHYHPEETVDEAMESVRFLNEHRHEISLFIIGEFGLTPRSKIFNHHGRYGIRKIGFHPDDDFRLYPFAEVQTRSSSSSSRHKGELDRLVSKAATHFKLRPYPFAGAISTHHSMLYFIRFGPGAFRRQKG